MLFCGFFLIQLPMIIPSLFYAFQDEDSTCQVGDRGGLNLSDWLKGWGFEKIAAFVVTDMYVVLAAQWDEGLFTFGVTVCVFMDAVFSFIWFIWGIVILATAENNRCVAEGKGMAIMAIIDLAMCASWSHFRVAKSDRS